MNPESTSDPGKPPEGESTSAKADQPQATAPAAIPTSAVHDAVRQWERRLQTSLEESQAKFAQSADRGEGNATAFREFLRAHLSPKYRIGQGDLIDYRANRSSQTDVVVADEEQPFGSMTLHNCLSLKVSPQRRRLRRHSQHRRCATPFIRLNVLRFWKPCLAGPQC